MKIIITLAAILAGLAIVTVSAGGPKQATIAVTQGTGTATFTVTQQNYANPHELWVANKCSSGGSLVSAEYHPVIWPDDGSGGQDPTQPGTTAPFSLSGDSCTAYVWEFPSSEDPERVHGEDVAVTYTIGP